MNYLDLPILFQQALKEVALTYHFGEGERSALEYFNWQSPGILNKIVRRYAELVLKKERAEVKAAQDAPLPPEDQAKAAVKLLKYIRSHPRRHDLDRNWLTLADEVLGTFRPYSVENTMAQEDPPMSEKDKP